MGIGRFLHLLATRVFVVAAFVGVIFSISGVTNATTPRDAFQATDVIAPATTTTTLTTSPASPVAQGTMVTLTATVAPPAAPGTVQFKDGTANLGDPVKVNNGTASGTISKLAVGSRQLTAVFTPTDPAAFSKSTSPVVVFMVTAPPSTGPMTTNTVLTTSSASPVTQGSPVTLIATVTPPAAAGTVQFKDGATNLGDPVTVSNGTASETTLISTVGSRTLTAEFTPANPAMFSSSTSAPLMLTVMESPQPATPQAQQSGQSLDGPSVLDGRGLTVLDLGGQNGGGLGVTVLDGGNVSNGPGLTLLDLGGQNDRRGPTVLDGRGLTVLRGGSGGLLSNLLHALL